jgi:hypothetical protein
MKKPIKYNVRRSVKCDHKPPNNAQAGAGIIPYNKIVAFGAMQVKYIPIAFTDPDAPSAGCSLIYIVTCSS